MFPKQSTSHVLVYLTYLVLNTLEQGSSVARLFLADFKKRFDLLDHNVIIKELVNVDDTSALNIP